MFTSSDWPLAQCPEYSMGDNHFEIGDLDGDGDSEVIQYYTASDSSGDLLVGWLHSYVPTATTPAARLVDAHGALRTPHLAFESKYNHIVAANVDDVTIDAGPAFTAYAGIPTSFPGSKVLSDTTGKPSP